MAVVVTSRPVPHGPRSPTLSDAGMILPHDPRNDYSPSPPPYIERPPSPPVLYSDDLTHVTKINPAPQSWRRPSHQRKTPPLSAQSSRSTLRNMHDSSAVSQGMAARDTALASSPTIQNGVGDQFTGYANGFGQRKNSGSSGSIHTEDLDNWPEFDSHKQFENSSAIQGDPDRKTREDSPDDTDIGEEMGANRWQQKGGSGSDEDDDEYTSAALSRRAEIILANAKKRLNVMEGNLRGARESLVISPTFNVRGGALDLSHHIAATRERDRRLYAGIGPIPPRIPAYRASPLSATASPGHSRGLSETSVSLPFTPSYGSRNTPSKRASSAIGHTSNLWGTEGFGHGRFPIKESRSVEVLRDPRNTWTGPEKDTGVRSQSRSSRSPPALETLPEDENAAELPRSASAASGLRDQVKDLKHKISNLKLKAQEDHLRRRSMQSLRTPSPFTSAETWYTGTDAYRSGGSPVAANAGLGIATESPTRAALYGERFPSPTKDLGNTEIAGEEKQNYEVKEQGYPTRHYPPQYNNGQSSTMDEQETYEEDDAEETDDAEFMSVNGDDHEAGMESVYEDAVYEMPATARHEDRIDAFDYEHFFLHSAMGTYGLDGRRSSTSSGSSTETTRPVTAVQNHEEEAPEIKRLSHHSRTASADSVSTVATFATAAEHYSDDEEENEQMDQFSQQLISSQHPMVNRHTMQNGASSLRSDSAINMRGGNGSSPTQTSVSRASSSPGELASGLQTSKIFTILTEGSRDEPRLALTEEETQLIYSVTASLQQVCSNMHSTYTEAYERKQWRRRLDEARRILSGEDDYDDDQSF